MLQKRSTKPNGLISVITPCFNPGERLKRCLASVASQTYKQVEHIVVDGGSTDGTQDLLASKPGVRWISEPDSGQSDAINKGFRLAQGQILTWLNADDYLNRETIDSVVNHLKTTGLEWCYGSARIEGPRGNWTWIPPRKLRARHFRGGSPIPQPSTFYSRKILDRVGQLSVDLHLLMDFDLWLRLYNEANPAPRINEVLSVIEIHVEAKSGHTPRARWLEEYAIVLHRHGYSREADVNLGRLRARQLLDNGWEHQTRGRRIQLLQETLEKSTDPGLHATSNNQDVRLGIALEIARQKSTASLAHAITTAGFGLRSHKFWSALVGALIRVGTRRRPPKLI